MSIKMRTSRSGASIRPISCRGCPPVVVESGRVLLRLTKTTFSREMGIRSLNSRLQMATRSFKKRNAAQVCLITTELTSAWHSSLKRLYSRTLGSLVKSSKWWKALKIVDCLRRWRNATPAWAVLQYQKTSVRHKLGTKCGRRRFKMILGR